MYWMKTFISNKVIPARPSLLLLPFAMLLFSQNVFADSRNEARNLVYKLRQDSTIPKMQDELASIETTFSVAEQYHKQNNNELSEQYYLLTIQKASVLYKARSTPAATIANSSGQNVLTGSPGSTQLPAPPPIPPEPKANTAESATPVHTVVPKAVAEPSVVSSSQPVGPVQPENIEDRFLSDTVDSSYLVGNPSIYTVVKNDTIKLIAAKLGVSRQHLMEVNKLNSKTVLKAGQQLKYNNRKIIPLQAKNGIIINIPEKTLYLFRGGKLAKSLPVALGVPVKNKKFDWRTPTGKFKIIAKQKDPTWYVPPSIQEEMEDEGKEVITSIPPGPTNPLGKYAFKTSLPGILIHSTIKPASINSFASHGCIRVYPQHMEEFFNEVKVHTTGEIIYKPVKLANTESGRIFLEVHHDAYGMSAELNQVAKKMIEKQNLAERVNWQKVKNVIRQKSGIAEDVTL
jgi:L,D-transpeptidase ErfK/SrfK